MDGCKRRNVDGLVAYVTQILVTEDNMSDKIIMYNIVGNFTGTYRIHIDN
jgi:hypothetical protein